MTDVPTDTRAGATTAPRLDPDLVGYLRTMTGETVLYRPNPGNAGDSLIALATYQAFAACGVRFEFLTGDPPGDRLRGRTVVYAGGGNLTPLYRDAAAFLAAHHREPARLVLLPHTVRGHEDLLRSFGPNVEIVCREETSYRHVAACADGARVRLMHDVAFSLDVDDALARPSEPRTPGLRQWRKRVVMSMRRRALLRRLAADGDPGGRRILHAFRRDREGTDVAAPSGNVDVPALFALGTWPVEVARTASRELLRFLDRFDTVRTNRLHVAIGAALLGKAVEFHANSYDKNRSVYEHSIAGRFPDVTWCG